MLLLPATLAGALLYGLSGFLLSAAWRELLGAERPPGQAAGYHAVYGRTQIAKYLPGNCFHFVGRQVLGRALGHSQAALALASLLEAALLTAVAAGLALPLALDRPGDGALTLLAGAGLALTLTLAAPRLLPARLWPGSGAARRAGLPAAGRLLRALALHVAFFVHGGWPAVGAGGGARRARRPARRRALHRRARPGLDRGLRGARLGGRYRRARSDPRTGPRAAPGRRMRHPGQSGDARDHHPGRPAVLWPLLAHPGTGQYRAAPGATDAGSTGLPAIEGGACSTAPRNAAAGRPGRHRG